MPDLRPATPADRPILERWDRDPAVIAAAGTDGWWDWRTELADPGDWRDMLIAELDGTPIGFVQIMDPAREPSGYWGDAPPGSRAIDIWIGEAWARDKGHGTAIMRLALARCFADPSVGTILIDPLETNVAARRFYRRLGFTSVGRGRFGPADCAALCLTRADWENRG